MNNVAALALCPVAALTAVLLSLPATATVFPGHQGPAAVATATTGTGSGDDGTPWG